MGLKSLPVLAGLLLGLCACAPQQSEPPLEPGGRPNILLIVADDLGYTDLGVYGGEIPTPRLDALAREGVLFTRFHAASTCSPTRAMLLSGVDNHRAGLGTMSGEHTERQRGQPGYEGFMHRCVVTLATLLGDAGYRTYMTGKWHLGLDDETGPAARGFQRSFALLPGGAGHFNAMPLFASGPAPFREDGRPVELPVDFYSTRFYASKMIEYLELDAGDDRPFFAYLAFTAPHWPLQAPQESIARHRGRYDAGYEVLHRRRLDRLVELGLLEAGLEAAPPTIGTPGWSELDTEQRRISSRKMEIYAAMVDDLDRHVGRVLDHLQETGELERTLVVFMSDNGAEGHDLLATWPQLAAHIDSCCDQSYENMGNADSYLDYGPGWARAGIGPFRLHKGYSTEGALVVPAFVSMPGLSGRTGGGRVFHGFASVLDIMPTLLELAGIDHPSSGRSLLPLLRGESDRVHPEDHVMGWELFGRRAIRKGPWKLVWTTAPHGPERWELFHVEDDPAELRDLASEMPAQRDELIALWERYVADNGVILPEVPIAY